MTRWCLVVEDEPALAAMLCDNLGLEGYGTEQAHDGEQALARLARGGIDVVVLDVMLPRLDGFEVLRRMRANGDATPVLVLSARGRDADRIRGLELAADDYLTKPFNLRELLLRIAALLRRRAAPGAGDDVLEFGGNRVDFRSHQVRTFAGRQVELTHTELKLLRLLSGRKGAVVPRRELIAHLFGLQAAHTHRTLDNLVLSLRRHFERDGPPRHLHTVRGVGLRFTGDAETTG